MRLCVWCIVAIAIEIALYLSYRGHDARFHWFTHFFIGASLALLVMTVVTLRTHRPVPLPLLWILLAHTFAMIPDLLFVGGQVHQRWMDVFLGHLSSHYVSGRNLTWYLIFLVSLALYLVALDHARIRSRM
jgi:hypothetical protein